MERKVTATTYSPFSFSVTLCGALDSMVMAEQQKYSAVSSSILMMTYKRNENCSKYEQKRTSLFNWEDYSPRQKNLNDYAHLFMGGENEKKTETHTEPKPVSAKKSHNPFLTTKTTDKTSNF